MNTVKITVDSQAAPKPMRDILGMNNIPRISSVKTREFEWKLFDALNIKHVRFHDAPIENSGHLLIDVSRIFPLFHLDENDSRNYRFAQTDDYLSPLQGRDIDIDFRMGETIDHSGNGRLIGVGDEDALLQAMQELLAK